MLLVLTLIILTLNCLIGQKYFILLTFTKRYEKYQFNETLGTEIYKKKLLTFCGQTRAILSDRTTVHTTHSSQVTRELLIS